MNKNKNKNFKAPSWEVLRILRPVSSYGRLLARVLTTICQGAVPARGGDGMGYLWH